MVKVFHVEEFMSTVCKIDRDWLIIGARASPSSRKWSKLLRVGKVNFGEQL